MKHRGSPLPAEQRHQLGRLMSTDLGPEEIAREIGISANTLARCLGGFSVYGSTRAAVRMYLEHCA